MVSYLGSDTQLKTRQDWRRSGATQEISMRALLFLAGALAVASLVSLVVSTPTLAWNLPPSKIGKPCKVTGGPNAGKTGTYDEDGACAGTWGATDCGSSIKGSKCADARKTAVSGKTVSVKSDSGTLKKSANQQLRRKDELISSPKANSSSSRHR
jgi:hypothetical protein